MCSVFGYVADDNEQVPLSVVERMARANLCRGPHAFGFAWITADGRLRSYKQEGRITDHMGLLAMTRGARMLIGHVRWATHGDPKNNTNNHPHAVDGGWLVHNGVLYNYRELVQDLALRPISECDSEVIGLMIERRPGALLDRTRLSVGKCEGPLTVMAMWARPARLIVARMGNPLHAARTVHGRLFSSLSDGLPPGVRSVSFEDDTAAEFMFSRDDQGGTKGVVNVKVQQVTRLAHHHVSSHAGAGRRIGNRGNSEEYQGG
jgi:glucosamine--fructose-6-phosphate aminotransferase (isomerizing)